MFPLLIAIGLSVVTSAFAADHSQDTEAQIKANLEGGTAILVDVREVEEWNRGHLADAANVPLSQLRTGTGGAGLPKDKIIYLHCQSGRRVLPAAVILRDAGFSDIRALAWGYPELLRRGFPSAD